MISKIRCLKSEIEGFDTHWKPSDKIDESTGTTTSVKILWHLFN